MTRNPLPFILIGLVVLLLAALGWRLPISDTASALLACVCGAILWKLRTKGR